MKTLAVLALVGAARASSCEPVGNVDGPGSRSYDAQAYSLTAQFDWAERRLHATEIVSVTAAPGQELIQRWRSGGPWWARSTSPRWSTARTTP